MLEGDVALILQCACRGRLPPKLSPHPFALPVLGCRLGVFPFMARNRAEASQRDGDAIAVRQFVCEGQALLVKRFSTAQVALAFRHPPHAMQRPEDTLL